MTLEVSSHYAQFLQEENIRIIGSQAAPRGKGDSKHFAAARTRREFASCSLSFAFPFALWKPGTCSAPVLSRKPFIASLSSSLLQRKRLTFFFIALILKSGLISSPVVHAFSCCKPSRCWWVSVKRIAHPLPPCLWVLKRVQMVTPVLFFLWYWLTVVPSDEHPPAVKHPYNHTSYLGGYTLSCSLTVYPPCVHDCSHTRGG